LERFKVLVTDTLAKVGIDVLSEAADVSVCPGISQEELKRIIGDYDALIVRSTTKVTREVIERAVKLRVIGRAGVGIDNIDVEAATEKGIYVVNSPDAVTIAAAEHTMALLLALARRVGQSPLGYENGDGKRWQCREEAIYGCPTRWQDDWHHRHRAHRELCGKAVKGIRNEGHRLRSVRSTGVGAPKRG